MCFRIRKDYSVLLKTDKYSAGCVGKTIQFSFSNSIYLNFLNYKYYLRKPHRNLTISAFIENNIIFLLSLCWQCITSIALKSHSELNVFSSKRIAAYVQELILSIYESSNFPIICYANFQHLLFYHILEFYQN